MHYAHRRFPVLAALLVVVALLVAACGGGAAAPAEPAAAPAAAEAPAGEAAAPSEEAVAATAAPVEEAATEEAAAATASPAGEAAAPAAEAAAPEGAQVRTFAVVPEQSQASYEVEEEFMGAAVSFVQTVGTTSAIEGSVTLALDGNSVSVQENQFTVDLRTLASDSPRRDNALRGRFLQSDTYPWAVFTATEVADLPADAALGQPVNFSLSGDMTIREVTNPLTWDVTATLDGSTLSGTAVTNLLMADYGFAAPDIAGMLRVTDGVTVTVNFVAQEAQ